MFLGILVGFGRLRMEVLNFLVGRGCKVLREFQSDSRLESIQWTMCSCGFCR